MLVLSGKVLDRVLLPGLLHALGLVQVLLPVRGQARVHSRGRGRLHFGWSRLNPFGLTANGWAL